DELDRSRAERRHRQVVVAKIVSNRAWQRTEYVNQQIELTTRFSIVDEPKARTELAKNVGVRTRLANRINDWPPQIHVQRTVGFGEVVAFEKRRRRQHDIGKECGVGHHLIEHDREQVLTLQSLEDAILIGNSRRRIAVVDEQHLDRWLRFVEQRARE